MEENKAIEKKVCCKEFIKDTDFFFFKKYNNKKQCGVYLFIFKNYKFYIGSTVNTQCRFSRHFKSAEKGLHFNKLFQNCWNKYGKPEIFIRKLNKNKIRAFEQFLIDRNINNTACINLANTVERPRIKTTVIFQYTLDGKFIRKYESIKDAGNTLGINAAHISESANENSVRASAGGYLWRYFKVNNLDIKPKNQSKYRNFYIIKKIDDGSIVEVIDMMNVLSHKERVFFNKAVLKPNVKIKGFYWSRVSKDYYNGI